VDPGKTALADLIATGGFGVSKQLNGSSFLRRAADYLTDSRVKLTWENGSETENDVASAEMEDLLDAPRSISVAAICRKALFFRRIERCSYR
jgi:hypothetical protein